MKRASGIYFILHLCLGTTELGTWGVLPIDLSIF
jgi:hypothetical protein